MAWHDTPDRVKPFKVIQLSKNKIMKNVVPNTEHTNFCF